MFNRPPIYPMLNHYFLAPALVLIALSTSTFAETVYIFNGPKGDQADYVSAHTTLNGAMNFALDPGSSSRTPLDLTTPFSPTTGYTGPIFYGGSKLTNTHPTNLLISEDAQTQRITDFQSGDSITYQVAHNGAPTLCQGTYQFVVVFPLPVGTVATGAQLTYARAKYYDLKGETLRFLATDGTRWFASEPPHVANQSDLTTYTVNDFSAVTWRVFDALNYTLGSVTSPNRKTFTSIGYFLDGAFLTPKPTKDLIERFSLKSFAYFTP
jgi:hypothetical protein